MVLKVFDFSLAGSGRPFARIADLFIDQTKASETRSGSIRPPQEKRKPRSNIAECVETLWCYVAYSCNCLLVVRTNGSHIRWGSMQCRNECDSKRVEYGKEPNMGRLWRAEVLSDVCLSFVSMRVLWKGKRDMRGREWACVAMDRRIGGWPHRVIYTLVSTTS